MKRQLAANDEETGTQCKRNAKGPGQVGFGFILDIVVQREHDLVLVVDRLCPQRVELLDHRVAVVVRHRAPRAH